MPYNNRYQYETSPRKLRPEYEPIKRTYPKKSSAINTKKKKKTVTKINQAKIILYVAIGFIALFVISYRYAMIDKTYSNLKEKKTELGVIEKETAQLEANIESNLKLTTIEQEAQEKLGMQKRVPEQTVLVTLPKTDYVETSSEEIKDENKNSNWFIELINKIIDTLK